MDIPVYVVVLLLVLVCAVAGVLLWRRGRGGKAKPAPAMSADSASALAEALLKAVGGKENVAVLEHCTTRLRFEVRRYAAVDEAALKAAGAQSVVRPAKNTCQVLLGEHAPQVCDAIKKMLE